MKKIKIVCPLSETKSRGVGILVKETLVNDEILEFRFFENRILSLDLKIDQNRISIVNIYAPNLRVEQVKFIEELHSFLYDKKNIIFGGDFNNSFGLDSDTGLEKKWNDLNKLFCLEEANKSQKNEKQFIYTWTNGHSTSRIDRLYLRNKEKILSLNYSECISNSISDHKIVISDLSILKSIKIRKFKKNSDWKLNENILENKKVNNYILKICSEIPLIMNHYKNDWYDIFINDIVSYLKNKSRIINNEKKKCIISLFNRLSILNIEEIEEREKIKREIQKYYEGERKGIEKRACDTKRNFIYQPSKVLIEKEIKNSKKKFVKKFKKENGQITDDPDEMLSEVYSFYGQLLSVDKVPQESIENYKFLIKPLNKIDDKIDIGYKITYAEAEEVVLKMDSSSPGPNGLTIVFFKKYFKYFGNFFIDILNNHQDSLPKTFMESKIKLIPKN